MIGSHLIRAYSKTQSVVAKSSGESELYAIIRASTEGLGIATLLSDFGEKDVEICIGIDATAAMGMAQRVGLNKVRHVEVDVLWIQEQQLRNSIAFVKVKGTSNPADLFTKYLSRETIDMNLKHLQADKVEGRSDKAA